jgi:hypothetical protein
MNGEIRKDTTMALRNYIKPLSAGAIAFGADYITSYESNYEKKMIFAGVVALGSFLGSMAVENLNIPVVIPNIHGYTGKQAEVKIAEIVATFGTAYGIDYVARGGSEFGNYELVRKGAIIAGAEILSETLTELIIQNMH